MIKILICDDEVFARDAMKTIVSRKGFNVFTAATGEECINMLKKESPEVIFLDVMLSDLDGDHLFKYLKDIKKDVDIYLCDPLQYDHFSYIFYILALKNKYSDDYQHFRDKIFHLFVIHLLFFWLFYHSNISIEIGSKKYALVKNNRFVFSVDLLF